MQEENLTKKEKRELAKEKKRQERSKVQLFQNLKKAVVGLLILGIVAFIGFKTWSWLTAPTPDIAGVSFEINENDWVKGNPDASVVLVEYADFECPACANFVPLIEELLEENSQDLKLVYRHFPLEQIHKNAVSSAKAAEAAGIQGKFWEMNEKLYETQEEWSELSDAKEKFLEYARGMGLDEQKFLQDYDSEVVEQKIKTDLASANALNLSYTPTFFLNGEIIESESYEHFKEMISSQIRGYNLE